MCVFWYGCQFIVVHVCESIACVGHTLQIGYTYWKNGKSSFCQRIIGPREPLGGSHQCEPQRLTNTHWVFVLLMIFLHLII